MNPLTPEEEYFVQQQMSMFRCSRLEALQYLQKAKDERERNRRREEIENAKRSYTSCFSHAFHEAEGPHKADNQVEAGKIYAMLAIADRLDELCRILKSRDTEEGE